MPVALVIGAYGPFGRAAIARLSEDSSIRIIPAGRNCEDANGLKLDICDYEILVATISQIKPDWVINFAGTYSTNWSEAFAINVDAVRNILNAVHTNNWKTRILLIGSAAEYGMVQPEDNPIREDRVLMPVSVYGLTKSWQTQLAGFYSNLGVDVIVARTFNLYGPHISEYLFIGRLQQEIDQVLTRRKSIIEIGPLSAIRDYVSVAEAADQLHAIVKYGQSGQIYHIGSGTPITMRDMLHYYLTMFGIDKSIVKESIALTNRTGYDVQVIFADIKKTLALIKIRKKNEQA